MKLLCRVSAGVALMTMAVLPSASRAAFPAPGDYTIPIAWSGQTRNLTVHIPQKCDLSKKWPLVFNDYNTAGGDAYVHMKTFGDTAGYIWVTWPGWSGSNTPVYMNTDYGDSALKSASGAVNPIHDDINAISAAIDYMVQNGNVDSKAVFYIGSSWGGLLGYKLAARLSSQLTAVCIIAGEYAWRCETYYRTMSQSLPSAVKPVSIIHYQCHGDSAVRYDHYTNGRYESWSAHESTRFWVDYDHCDNTPKVDSITMNGTPYKVERWINGTNGSSVELHVAWQNWHGWALFPVTDSVWTFFKSKITTGSTDISPKMKAKVPGVKRPTFNTHKTGLYLLSGVEVPESGSQHWIRFNCSRCSINAIYYLYQ